MSRIRTVLVTGLALAVLGVGFMVAQDKAAKEPDREADKQAIDKIVQQFVQAFNNRDAAATAAHWTDEGEYMNNDGVPVRGKVEIQKGYAEFFKALKGKPTLEIQIDGLRFTSADTAVSEVTLRLKNEDGEYIGSSWRNTLLVREGGQWKVASVQEWDRDSAVDVSLKELDWLIGSWQAANKDRELTSTFEWDENKSFIRGKYTVKEGGKVIESGTQIIGKDNAEGAILSWVFQTDGGFGDGYWTREGNKWTVDITGVTADGRIVEGSAIYLRLDANTYTWQAVNQIVDGVAIADSQPIKVTKQKAEK